MNNRWYTSDIHFYHKNITSGESKWPDKEHNCRQFATTKEMSQHMIKQINKYVDEGDILYFLGDWSFQGIENIWNLRKQLRCKTIHFIYGNHDGHIISNKLLPNCGRFSVESLEPSILVDKDSFCYDVYAQELFASFQEKLDITINDKIFKLSHHSPQNKYNKQFYYLYGHVHGKNGFNKESQKLDVGIDNAFNIFGEYRPFSDDDVKQLMLC